MRDPELRSPHKWAEELRSDADALDKGGSMEKWPEDCRELADRMDDLTEALRLLRVWLGPEPWKQPLTDAQNLLAKYASEEG